MVGIAREQSTCKETFGEGGRGELRRGEVLFAVVVGQAGYFPPAH